MALDEILLRGLITLFSGFIVSLISVINKSIAFFEIMNTFFVVFFFVGIIITLLGALYLVAWNFQNQLPFEDEIHNYPFVTKLTIGAFVLLFGSVLIFYVGISGGALYLVGLPSCFVGLFYLIKGGIEYIRDYYLPNQKMPSHS